MAPDPENWPPGSCRGCGHRWADHDEKDGCGACALEMKGPCKRWPERELRVRSVIERGLDRLYEGLDLGVSSGDFTDEEVREQMVFYDLSDGWDDYVAEGAE